MGFNPLEEKGIPFEQQLKSWDQANVQPYDKHEVHPYTRTRVILMNGIEVEGALFKHQFARHADNTEVRQQLALTRRIEQQQQKMVNWLIPSDETNLEVTLGFEQVAVDLTAWLAKTEPDPAVKAALDYALLEDFDHLYRYANLYEMTEGKQAQDVVGDDLTEIFPGRPTVREHQHPLDTVRPHFDGSGNGLLTKLHIMTIVAAEQQTMNLYMNVGNRAMSMLGRGLYLEIAQIEEQHVTHYESLIDPRADWWERAVLHEYNECYLYYACMRSEIDERIRKYWEFHLGCEIQHLHAACEMMRRFGRRDPLDMLPDQLPEPLVIFQPNREYVRKVLAEQVDWTTNRLQIVEPADAPQTYRQAQELLNSDGVPSQQVISEHIDQEGSDYRLEIDGPHPVQRFRTRESVTA